MTEAKNKMQSSEPGEMAQSSSNRLMTLLNSRFVIWALGVIFLSILPIIIKVTRLSYDDEKRITAKKEMLEVEIYHRMKHIEMLQKPVKPDQLDDALFAFYGLDDSLVKQRHWHYYNFKPIYGEFEKTPFRNLVIEFTTVQSDPNQLRRTKDIAHLLDQMKHQYLIVDFEDAKVKINGQSYYDIRQFAKDAADLRTVFLDPIRDWSKEIEGDY